MRRNRELNTWEKKDLARRKYAERKLQKFIDWSIESKGYLKYKDLIKYSSPVKLNLMRKLKDLFDPNGIMNPGVILK